MSRCNSTRGCKQIKFRKQSISVVEYQAMETRIQHSQEIFLLSAIFKTALLFRRYPLRNLVCSNLVCSNIVCSNLVCSNFRNVVVDLNIGDNGNNPCDCWWHYLSKPIVRILYVTSRIKNIACNPSWWHNSL